MNTVSTEVVVGPKMQGFIKIWQVDPKTGERKLLRDQPNLILYSGSDIMAQCLAGVTNANISYLYIGYQNTTGSVTPAPIDKSYSTPFSIYGSTGTYANYGYLRVPLAYSPSFASDPNSSYTSNIALFTGIVTTSSTATNSVPFHTSSQNPPSNVFEVALVSALNPSNSTQDKVFSRASFVPLTYDSNFNLTITWGVRFLS